MKRCGQDAHSTEVADTGCKPVPRMLPRTPPPFGAFAVADYLTRRMPSGWTFLVAGGASFLLSLILTRVMTALAPRIGFVDKPGHRKIHANPKPLGGGVAIFWTFAFVFLISGVAAMWLAGRGGANLFGISAQ